MRVGDVHLSPLNSIVWKACKERNPCCDTTFMLAKSQRFSLLLS